MRNEQTIKDWKGKIIGFIEVLPNGDKIIRDFYRKILGKFDSRLNVTKDFYGRIIAQGDLSTMLFNK